MSEVVNPKKAVGARKLPMDLIPSIVAAELSVVMALGAITKGYGRWNWHEAGVDAETYYAAALRHLTLWRAGEDIDPESGVSHLIHAMACLTIVRDAQDVGMFQDNRRKSREVLRLLKEFDASTMPLVKPRALPALEAPVPTTA